MECRPHNDGADGDGHRMRMPPSDVDQPIDNLANGVAALGFIARRIAEPVITAFLTKLMIGRRRVTAGGMTEQAPRGTESTIHAVDPGETWP
jgi:hypothetical protein